MTSLSVIVFAAVYLGMAVGSVPGLALERTGVALIGLIVLLASGDLSMTEAGAAVDMPTIILLLSVVPHFTHGGLTGLALLSTFAGNLLLTGSLCNIIVAERAAAVCWLWFIGALPV